MRSVRGDLVRGVFDEVRARILDGRLAAGSPLRERDLSAELDVSRVPIREALPLLAAAGLVTLEPRRPAVVTTVTRSSVDELYDIRAVLEPLAAAKAAVAIASCAHPAALTDALDRAREALAADDLTIFHVASGDVHHGIEELARSELFVTVMNPLRERSNRLNVVNIASHPRLRHDEHEHLVDAILRGLPDLARAVAYSHVEFGRARVIETLSAVPGYDPNA